MEPHNHELSPFALHNPGQYITGNDPEPCWPVNGPLMTVDTPKGAYRQGNSLPQTHSTPLCKCCPEGVAQGMVLVEPEMNDLIFKFKIVYCLCLYIGNTAIEQ